MGICVSVSCQKIRWKRVCWNSSLKWRLSYRWLEWCLPWNLNLKVISRFQNKWSVWCTCAPIFFANTHALTPTRAPTYPPTHNTHTLNTHTRAHTHAHAHKLHISYSLLPNVPISLPTPTINFEHISNLCIQTCCKCITYTYVCIRV